MYNLMSTSLSSDSIEMLRNRWAHTFWSRIRINAVETLWLILGAKFPKHDDHECMHRSYLPPPTAEDSQKNAEVRNKRVVEVTLTTCRAWAKRPYSVWRVCKNSWPLKSKESRQPRSQPLKKILKDDDTKPLPSIPLNIPKISNKSTCRAWKHRNSLMPMKPFKGADIFFCRAHHRSKSKPLIVCLW